MWCIEIIQKVVFILKKTLYVAKLSIAINPGLAMWCTHFNELAYFRGLRLLRPKSPNLISLTIFNPSY